MTVYSYLLCANKLMPAKAETIHRFDVLLKLKEPRLDIYYTTRSAADRRRLAKLNTPAPSSIAVEGSGATILNAKV